MNKQYIIVILAAVVFGAAGFAGGIKYQQSFGTSTQPASSLAAGAGARQGRFGGSLPAGGGQNGARSVSGQIISLDSNSITVKLADGSSKIVLLTGTTKVNQTVAATTSDLKTGATVVALGTANSDGSLTATEVSLNPTFGMGRGGQVGSSSGQRPAGQ